MNKKAALFSVIFFAVLLLAKGLLKVNAQQEQPPAPTGISVSVGEAPSQITVSWTASPDSAVVGYYLYRNGVLIVDSPGFTYYLDNVTVGGVYDYTVAAYDNEGNVSPQSTPVYVTVVEDTTPPSVPTGVTATTTSASSITISWIPSTDNVGVAGYYLYRNNTKIITTNAITGSPYVDSGLSPGNYSYSLTAYDASGNISDLSAVATATILYDVTPPSVPSGLSISTSSGVNNLSWNPSLDSITPVQGYYVYRDGSELGTVPTPSYQDSNLMPATTYSYNVSAYDLYGNVSATSTSVSMTTPPLDTTPPSIPTDFYATPVSASQVNLTWSPSIDNVGVAGYTIYRNNVELGTTASTSYIDTGLTTSTLYVYAISAYDAAGNNSPQATVAATTLAYTPVVVASTTPATSTTSTTTTTTTSPTTPPPTTTSFTFTTALYYGLRNSNVLALQNFLIQAQYLGTPYNTGFYGSLTQKAVQKFQCAQDIVCSGSPATTGWGSVGPRTRRALNQRY
jgi:chitodextrinase